jgi:cobalt/nickel transport system ATP-binding protein
MRDTCVIEVAELRYTYPDGKEALAGVTFTVRAKEKIAIIGPNGAGKSTLLAHLNGVKSGQGSVRIGGLELDKHNLREIRRRVGIVFQDPDDQLFCPTVFDDVAFGPLNLGLPAETVRSRVDHALAQVGMRGYEQRAAYHLSFGEKKSISIATVLSMEPDILVLDEPTSELDPRGRRNLIDLLRGFDKTIVIATHDLDLVLDLCSRCVIMNKGTIVYDGASRDALSDAELLRSNGLELPLCMQGGTNTPDQSAALS